MAAKYESRAESIKLLTREDAAARLNAARDVHFDVTESVVPVDKGILKSTLAKDDDATAEKLQTGVSIGGPEAPYAEDVEFGHSTANGGRVPGQFFFGQGFEEGGRALTDKSERFVNG